MPSAPLKVAQENNVPERALLILKILAAAFAVVGGGLKIASLLEGPKVIYATKDIASYPMGYKELDPSTGLMESKVLIGPPILLQALVVQNKGQKTATDILVRIPIIDSDGYIGGWMARGDNPVTHYLGDQITEYKIDKLIPEESVSFYIYLKNASSDIATRIQVFDGQGRHAPYYPYTPLRKFEGGAFTLSVPRWYLTAILLVFAILSFPNRAQREKVAALYKRMVHNASVQAQRKTSPKRTNKSKKGENI